MSKQRAKNRAVRQREAGAKASAQGSQRERHERRRATGSTSTKQAGRKPTKTAGSRGSSTKKRGHAPVGRADGPLARRRRFRIRLLIAVLVVVNVACAVIWRDWSVSLAVLILSIITAPLAAAVLLRRR